MLNQVNDELWNVYFFLQINAFADLCVNGSSTNGVGNMGAILRY